MVKICAPVQDLGHLGVLDGDLDAFMARRWPRAPSAPRPARSMRGDCDDVDDNVVRFIGLVTHGPWPWPPAISTRALPVGLESHHSKAET